MTLSADLAPFAVHGGRVAMARAAFGGDDWIDLSTGIAPWTYPVPGDLGLDRLPEPGEIAALEEAAAAAFGVADASRVVAVPGTDLALRLLARVLRAARPAVVTPGYGGHRAAWPDAEPVSEPFLSSPRRRLSGRCATGESHGSQPALGRQDEQIWHEHDLIVFASPSNPTGAVVAAEAVHALAEHMTVVADEAYADPLPGLAPEASDRLVVLRSFGKFFGLPGLRLGFVVAGDTVAADLRALLGDWPISTAAAIVGTAAYRDVEWRTAQAARIVDMGAALDSLLGERVIGRAPLFRLIAVEDAATLFRRCAARAILTRPFADDPRRLRIGVPADAAGLERLADALEDE